MDCEMTSSNHTLLRLAAKLTRCLSLALLPALASEARALSAPQRKTFIGSSAAQTASSASSSATTPYLTVLGSLPLRFARPNLDRSDEPPAAPVPKVVEIAPEKAEPGKTQTHELASQSVSESKPAEQPSLDSLEKTAADPEPITAPALPILPDDTKRELRPEEVLLYFRYPNAGRASEATTHVIVPLTPAQSQSGPIPSSATYQQK
jgi:hypothetical protein